MLAIADATPITHIQQVILNIFYLTEPSHSKVYRYLGIFAKFQMGVILDELRLPSTFLSDLNPIYRPILDRQ
jgi:hypothetical protein